MSRVIRKVQLDLVLPDEMTASDVKRFMENDFDAWLNSQANGAVLGVEITSKPAGRGWRDEVPNRLDLMRHSDDPKWKRIKRQYDEGFFSLNGAAELCGISRTAVYNWVTEGKLEAVKDTDNWLIPADEFIKYASTEG